MDSQNAFTCCIIGEGTLPIQCGEILLHRGHEICGIISPDASVNRWAEGKNIPHADPRDDLIAFLRQRPFDYLFSIVNIVNYHTLLKESLELPRKGAINYHDALLPRYAGFHPTSWALMQRETTHGVTWHLMTDLIDAGDILRQSPVDIADDDTAFTLNAKCYEAAIRSFAELVEDLSCGQASARKQDLDERTYSPLHKRPPAGCVLSWNWCAQDIDAFIRALDFGPYPNPLGLPKLALGKDFIIVPQIEVLDSMSETPPGTVTASDPGALKVATADREIALLRVLTIDGEELLISDLIARLELREGDRFSDLEPEIARRLTTRYASVCQHEDFWVQRLATLQPLILPSAAHKAESRSLSLLSPVKPGPYATVPIPIPEEVLTFLESRGADWSRGDFLLAAFAAYLARIGGGCRFDLGFSDVELQRDLAGLEGFFAAHVPLRVDVDYAWSFRELVREVREQAELVRRHETYARDVVTRYPMLRSAPSLRRGHSLPVIVAQTEKLDDYRAVPGSELTLVISEDRAECRWVYDAKVLSEDNVVRLAGQFATFLQGIAADRDLRLAELSLLTATECHRLLVEFNHTRTDYPRDRCLHHLFEAQVERTPEARAVVCADEQLTYRELNARANKVAHYLGKLGVGPETLVGICVERSVEMVVGLLGILKAGGAYVPLDPAYPKERLALILADTQSPLVLTQQRLLPGLPEHVARAVCLDAHWETIAQEQEQNLLSKATPDNLAYVIYTSGSTGKPNGVMIEHHSLVNYLCWVNQSLLGDALHLPMVSGLSFDASLKQLFAPLLRGAEVWILPTDVVTQPAALLQALGTRSRVGLNCVPSLWAALLEAIKSDPTLRPDESFIALLVGGERLSQELVAKSRATLPRLEIWNLYGPTETTANASVTKIASDGAVTIGCPIANTQIYILDSHLQPVPIGVAGELYIGGAGLARGYLNRPDLTSEKFIADPYSGEPGARLYQTGDEARHLSSGEIEFLGRTDDQVKLRGFRIELGEVEAALSSHPTVRESVVLAREDLRDEKRLVAYVAPNQGQTPTISELRRFLQERLPEYMVPAAFVLLEALPLTPSGKVDRRALPAPDQARPEMGEAYLAPRTPTEEILAGIWAEALKLGRVGIHDDFFALGGHSLLATQIISRLRDAFQVELPLRALFESPTVAGLAERIETARRAMPGLPVPPIRPVPREGDLPLSFAQQRVWLLDQLEPGLITHTVRYYLRLTGPLNVAALEASLSEIVRRHETLRTTFAVKQGRPVQVITPAEPLSLPVVDLSHLPETEREAETHRLATAEAEHRFDLARGPLLRVSLLRLGAEEHLLLLTMHHIAADGWSRGVFIRELALLYRAFAEGKPSPLEELPIQYADFACWQREHLQGEALEQQLAYWRQQLAGAPATSELPTDRPRPPVKTFRGATQPLILFDGPASLSERLKALSRREEVSLFMTLLAAFKTLLYRYTGQTDILVGTFVANRNRAETEKLIGFFVNLLALRTDLSGNPSFRELLRRVREVTLGAYAHQDLPFEKLLKDLQPKWDLSRTLLFQVMLVLHNTPVPEAELPGLTVSHLRMDRRRSDYDLTVWLSEEEKEGLTGWVEYNTELFEAATVTRMLEDFQSLLEAIVANPDQRLAELGKALERDLVAPDKTSAHLAKGDDLSLRRDELSARWAKLSAAKQALFEKWLRGQVPGPAPAGEDRKGQ